MKIAVTDARVAGPPLGIQLTLPEDFARDRDFADVLSVAREMGVSELELNIARPRTVDPVHLASFLSGQGLRLTRFATGATARLLGLSLSSSAEPVRERSLTACIACIRYAESLSAELIIGSMKGPPETDVVAARKQFHRSLDKLVSTVGKSPVPLLLEVTNSRESSVLTTMEEAAVVASSWPGFGFRVLPDTYHLAAESVDIAGALVRHLALFRSLHVSDDNRLVPGLGGIDFPSLFRRLFDAGYTGSLVIEGSHRGSLREDLLFSLDYLAAALRAP